MRTLYLPAALAAAALVLSACDTNDPTDDGLSATIRVTSIAADTTTGRSSTTGQPISTGRFTLYSLRENKVVLDFSNPNRADSATTKWDIGFRGATIIVNGGSRGPGQGASAVVTSPFEALVAAPDTGFVSTGTVKFNAGSSSIASVWTYTPATNLVTPTPGRTLVVKTADGKYAKIKLISYYKGNPATPSSSIKDRFYTFDYVVQTDGTKSFE